MRRRYLLDTSGNEPRLLGPYDTEANRQRAAVRLTRRMGDFVMPICLTLTAPRYIGLAAECVRLSADNLDDDTIMEIAR